jgi:hypothetical protein
MGNVFPKNSTLQPEYTFGELSIELMISQTLKDNSEVFGVFFLVFGIDENIIDKYHDESVKLRHKNGVH